MKKSFLFGILAAALGLSACNTEDEIFNNPTAQKGMVLHATVAQSPDTRATISNLDKDTWKFAFTTNDVVEVTNDNEIDEDGNITNSYYFYNNGANFTCYEVTPTTEATTWYAFYPETYIDLINQEGTIDAVAAKYVLAGSTTTATTGEEGLHITLTPQVAVLKINNQKGSIYINARNEDGEYIYDMFAHIENGKGSYTIDYTEVPFQLFTVNKTGTYYIIVPAGEKLTFYDGDTELKATGDNGLEAGKYYEMTVDGEDATPTLDRDANLIQGLFSVGYNKQVQFTKGNLYWDGSAYGLEANQYDYPTSWDATHVGHFYWTSLNDYNIATTGSYKPYAETYAYSNGAEDDQRSEDDEFWCGEENPLQIGETQNLYSLTEDEWSFVLYHRLNAGALCKYFVTINGVKGCLVLAPDNYTGTLEDSYDATAWKAAQDAGCVCLPPCGYRSGIEILQNSAFDYSGYYVTATTTDNELSFYSYFQQDETGCGFSIIEILRDYGGAIRLVKTAK